MIPSYKNYTLIIIYAFGAMCVLMTKDLVGPLKSPLYNLVEKIILVSSDNQRLLLFYKIFS